MQLHSGVFYCINNPQWNTKCFPKKVYDTKSKDNEGKLALHKACECNAPIEVIKFILATYPDAAIAQDDYGNVPLNYILQHQSCRRTARHTTNKKVDYEKMKYILQVIEEFVVVGPSSVLLENKNSTNFFEVFVETFYPSIRTLMDSSDTSILDSPGHLLKHIVKVEEGTLYTTSFVYDVVILLLKASFLCSKKDNPKQTFLPLHASLSSKRCPYVFSELIMRIDPSQTLLLNSNRDLLIYFNTKICCSSLAMDDDFEYKRVLIWERFSDPLLCDDDREQTQVLFLIFRENPLLLNVKAEKDKHI